MRQIGIWCRTGSHRRPKSMVLEMNAAKRCPFPAIMGQQSLCQKAAVALEKLFYTYY
jgi:hypothetical protein